MTVVNTFGTAKQQFALYDPRGVRQHRARFRRDLFPELDLANSYYSMAGRWPDVGWLLIDRKSLDQLSPYSSGLQLTIGDFVNAPITVGDLSLVQARCVTRGLASDPAAIYLVQVTNNQGVLYNPWFQYPVNAQYNVRAPAYDGSYYTGSLTGPNNTDAWTWDGMVGDLWSRAGGLLGTYPHLPTAPIQAPEGFSFVGVPLWEAVSHVMDYLGMAVSGSFPSFAITVSGTPDAAYAALSSKYAKYLEDSMEYKDSGSGRVPSQVVVYFHRRNQVYGTEETARRDSLQWRGVPAYGVTVPAPAMFSAAAGTGFLWADYTVRYDADGNPLAADAAQAQATAVERAAQFFDTIYRGTQGYARSVYAGALPFTTGSLVDGVRWFNTGRLGSLQDEHCGWRTEVLRGYVWPEVTFELSLRGLTGPL